MTYLDYNKLAPFVARHFAHDREARLVGRERTHDSGYFDIKRFYGAGRVPPELVQIVYRDSLYAFTDARIAAFAEEITARMTAEGRLYAGPTVARLADDNWTSQSLTIQEATYGAQAGSCFALDLPHPLFAEFGGTLRDYYPSLAADHSVKANPLAICFGACGLVRATEGDQQYLLRVMRGKKLASLEASYGPSIAGSVEWATDYKTLWDITVRTMIQEAAEEMALRPTEYRVIPLAYAREIYRGEKPQVFCLVDCLLSRAELSHRLAAIPEEMREFSEFDFHPLDAGALPSDIVTSLNHEAKMNYYLVEEYLASPK